MVCNIKVVEVSREQLSKGILFPFGVEASEAVEMDTLGVSQGTVGWGPLPKQARPEMPGPHSQRRLQR